MTTKLSTVHLVHPARHGEIAFHVPDNPPSTGHMTAYANCENYPGWLSIWTERGHLCLTDNVTKEWVQQYSASMLSSHLLMEVTAISPVFIGH